LVLNPLTEYFALESAKLFDGVGFRADCFGADIISRDAPAELQTESFGEVKINSAKIKTFISRYFILRRYSFLPSLRFCALASFYKVAHW
jgi:hypothetical protein